MTRKSACRIAVILPILLSALCAACASGPPGRSRASHDFLLYTEAPRDLAGFLSRTVQACLEDEAAYLGLAVPPGGLLRVYHFSYRWRLWLLLRREAPPFGWRKGACYETNSFYVVALYGNPRAARFLKALRHELSHYLIAVHFAYVPPWIDEGIAQIMAEGPVFPLVGRGLPEGTRRIASRAGEDNCMRVLLARPGEKLSRDDYHIALALSFHLLTRFPDGRDRLLDYLEAYRPDTPPERCFLQSWGISMEEACRGLRSANISRRSRRGRFSQ